MARVSWPDRKRIKRTIRDAYDPAMRDKFPASTPEIMSRCHSSDPTCPIGVAFLILNIQVALLRARDGYAVMLFRQLHEQRLPMAEVCRRQRTDHRYIERRIDRMLDDAITCMKQGTASMILSVYWEMHKESDYEIVGGK